MAPRTGGDSKAWSHADRSTTEAQRKSVSEASLKDLKVKNYLFQAIDREILETILDKSTS